MARPVSVETLARRAAGRAAHLPLLVLASASLFAACAGGSSSGGGGPPCADGETQPCYSGPQGTAGVGVCHGGTRTCSGGAFGPCAGEQLPSAETCNGLDDDCNGVVDNGAGATCASGVCAAGQCQLECTGTQTAPCYTGPAGTAGVGVCHTGTKTCQGTTYGPCVGQVVPSAETCNGLDDDCNGVVDDGAAASSCTSLVCASGACQAPTCSDGVKNQDETDVDCGGSTCPKCASALHCLLDRDCQSGMCFAGTCRASLNGCTPGTATDLTAQATVTISFPVGLTTPAYDKPCIKVKSGTAVTFSGDFPFHPLQGGAIFSGTAVVATSGPYAAVTNVGTTRTDTLSTGNYPYYCTNHGVLYGMAGTIFAVP